MMKIILAFVFLFAFSCSKNESPSSSNWSPEEVKKEDPLKLGGTGACTVEKKSDCDTKK